MQLDYNKEKFTKVIVCGIECDFSDMRIDSLIEYVPVKFKLHLNL